LCSVRFCRRQIEGIDEDNARVVIRLKLGGSVITLNQLAVELVNRKEYEKYANHLSEFLFEVTV